MANSENNKQSNSKDNKQNNTFRSYKVGDKDKHGREIKKIYSSGPSYIVYSTGYGNCFCEFEKLTEYLERVIAEYSNISAIYSTKLRGAYQNDFANLMGTAISSALGSTEDEDPSAYFDIVNEFIKEKGPIEKVYGYGSDYIIFENKKKQISCEYRHLDDTRAEAIKEFKKLLNLSNCSLPKSYQETAHQMLGDELATSFLAGKADYKRDIKAIFFQSSREYIKTRSQSYIRSRYTIYSLFSALVILAILLRVYLNGGSMNKQFIELLVGCAGGVIGALISVMQRGQSLEHERFVPMFYMVFQGFFRILLGVIFGFLVVVGIKANLVLGTVGEDMYFLVILSVAAGFSERLIPDLLTRIGEEKLKEDGASPEETRDADEGS